MRDAELRAARAEARADALAQGHAAPVYEPQPVVVDGTVPGRRRRWFDW